MRIAVLGGGLSGLTAAYALQKAGASVTLFESSDHLGGRAFTDELDGFRVDTGAQLVGSMYSRFRKLMAEIGLDLVRVPGRDALWRDGRAHEVVYGSVASMATSGGLPFFTKMKLGASYVPFLTRHGRSLDLHAPEKAAAAGLDSETIAAWGGREMDETFVKALVYPQLGAYYGARPEETSAGFYHILARGGMDVTLFALPGGMGSAAIRLHETLQQNGADIRTGVGVERLSLSIDSAAVVAGGSEYQFDAALSAVPAPVLLEIAAEIPADLREWLGAVRYRASFSLALLLDRPVGARYFGLSFPQGATRYVAAVGIAENKGVPLVPSGKGLLLALPTPESSEALAEMESREIVERMLPEILRAIPGIDKNILRARVYRWRDGSPIFFPGYLAHLGAFRAGSVKMHPRLAIAGDYLYAPSVEGAVSSGLDAAASLARRLQLAN